jgi:hypothetical protein
MHGLLGEVVFEFELLAHPHFLVQLHLPLINANM